MVECRIFHRHTSPDSSDFKHLPVADDMLDILFEIGEDFFHHRVGFGMHRRGIQRVVAVHDTQEARRLFKGLVAQARHFAQRGARGKHAFVVAVGDDALRHDG